MNIHEQSYSRTYDSNSLGHICRIELQDHTVPLCSNFQELLQCSLKWLHHFKFPLAIYEGSSFSTSALALSAVHLFNYYYPSRYELYHCHFYFYFPNDQCCWTSFHGLVSHLCIFFLKKCQNSLTIFQLHWLFIAEL